MTQHITLLALGGTIDSRPTSAGAQPGRLVEEVLSHVVEGVTPRPDISVERLWSRPSNELRPEDFLVVARRVHELTSAQSVAGVVITTGTDTLEELAYAVALTVRTNVPVAITGAMRVQGAPGWDGERNLRDALTLVAAGEQPYGSPFVVFGSEVFPARSVVKWDPLPDGGLGNPFRGRELSMTEGRVARLLENAHDHYIGSPAGALRTVDLHVAAGGIDSALLLTSAAEGRGAVIAGMGAGHVPPTMLDGVDAMIGQGLPVVVASRCVRPSTLSGTYAGPGSETDLLQRGAVLAGRIDAVKARLRLIVGWTHGLAPSDIFPVG